MSVIETWGSTESERARHYPCQDAVPDAAAVLYRAISIDAPTEVIYRWLCQMKVAPYSYDLIDNLGRRSPRTLTPGVEDLVIGEKIAVVFRVHAFELGHSITMVTQGRLFGTVAMTYEVTPGRLVGVLALGRKRFSKALAAGDLVMMRKQLMTFKALSEDAAGSLTGT